MNGHVFLLFLVCALVSACGGSNSKLKEENMQPENSIIFEIELPEKSVHPGSPILVEATLINRGNAPVVINKRMAIGYESTLSREIYATLTDPQSKKEVTLYPADINRDFSPPSDYISLSPGDSVSTTFDLTEFYAPPAPGKYQLTLFYQADEALASAPDDVLPGVYTSNSIDFEVVPNSDK